MQRLSAAKWGYVTRRVPAPSDALLGGVASVPRLGDFVVAKVTKLGAHEHLENPRGRRMRMYPGDLVVGAWGNRYATDFYEGYLPGPGDGVHLLTSGGLVGSVASAHTAKEGPTELEVVGPLTGGAGAPLNSDDVAVPLAVPAYPELGTIVVVGSSMNAGKTTATSAVVRGLSRAGLCVGAGKVTGSGRGKDHWAYRDAGAAVTREAAETTGLPVLTPAELAGGSAVDLLAERRSVIDAEASVPAGNLADLSATPI
jgi:hypothetical protein